MTTFGLGNQRYFHKKTKKQKVKYGEEWVEGTLNSIAYWENRDTPENLWGILDLLNSPVGFVLPEQDESWREDYLDPRPNNRQCRNMSPWSQEPVDIPVGVASEPTDRLREIAAESEQQWFEIQRRCPGASISDIRDAFRIPSKAEMRYSQNKIHKDQIRAWQRLGVEPQTAVGIKEKARTPLKPRQRPPAAAERPQKEPTKAEVAAWRATIEIRRQKHRHETLVCPLCDMEKDPFEGRMCNPESREHTLCRRDFNEAFGYPINRGVAGHPSA